MRGVGMRRGVHTSNGARSCQAAMALALLTVCIGGTTAVQYAFSMLQPGPGVLTAPLRGCPSGAWAHDARGKQEPTRLALRGGGEEGDSEFAAGEEGPSVKGGTYHSMLTVRLIDSCITQLKAQGPSRTCNESKEKKKTVAA